MQIHRGLILVFALTAFARASGQSLDFKAIDTTLSRVAVHAKNYPPRFSSPEEKAHAEKELREIIPVLDRAAAEHPDNSEYLLRDGFANSMGHNLDIKGCAERAYKAYEHLLALRPDDRDANFHFGAFLGGVGRTKDSIHYLQKAVSLGATVANYSLAIGYLMVQDRTNAIACLKKYVAFAPDDVEASKLLRLLQTQGVRFERKQTPPSAHP